ncbi:hypothetical protein BDB00DRAFT_870330 [Zychaea mexicana]|uniref:uncharacterized protein n=1 Tax=Zychaea mexicana TaxID=64656 RepID=UPI0022FEC3C9|nr:uncharacterized protein BDB00DRAFT_870330 [Zychaea mexicana]KAI9495475.1 hypothetical protein BDB00DRAFT_870330 [Zychaea mexicana]
MAPPNAESLAQGKLDLKQLAREKGRYLVYPETKYPELAEFEHVDPGHRADPKKASLYDNAEIIFDLTPQIGTEIHGLQLNRLTDRQKDDLALLVAERGVVFFRKQDINVHEAIELGKHYGPLHIHNTFGHPKGLPEIHVVYFDTKTPKQFFNYRSAGNGWHSDVSYEKQPPGLTVLKIDLLPAVGGDTMWNSQYTAYDRLSPQMKKFVEGLEAVHTGQMQVDEANKAGHAVRRETHETVHPVVRTHPVTKWKALYVQPGFTKRIVGFTRRESDAILNFLYNHIESGHDFQVRFKWEEDSVAVWDNRVTSHNAIFDYLDVGSRHGFRVTPQAEKPYFDANSKSKHEDDLEKAQQGK